MSIELIVAILVFHYLGDFMLQNELMATNKSSDLGALLAHTVVYTIALVPLCVAFTPINALLFLTINFVMHTMTDYLTSRVVKNLFVTEQYYTRIPNLGAFSVIGFDQLVHFLTLFITAFILL